MLEKGVDQRCRRPDVAFELDLADVALDRPQHEYGASVHDLNLAADNRQDVPVRAIPGLQCIDDGVQLRPGHGGADESGIE